MMDNYIVINGKKAELTEEQLKQLGINVQFEKNNPFGKITDNGYYYISTTGSINFAQNLHSSVDEDMYNNVNYFNNEHFTNQVMLHMKLYRKLLKYAYDNDSIVTDWTDPNSNKYFISKSIKKNTFFVSWCYVVKSGCEVYFTSKEVTERAIMDVVIPFMKEHPEFVW